VCNLRIIVLGHPRRDLKDSAVASHVEKRREIFVKKGMEGGKSGGTKKKRERAICVEFKVPFTRRRYMSLYQEELMFLHFFIYGNAINVSLC
jgi:hypothetical protein